VRAITAEEVGGPSVLRLSEVPDVRPGVGEVLIETVAAGVNRADLLQRAGRYTVPADAPPYLGLEVSGVISAVGPGVSEWQVGDRVCALLSGGGYAESAVASASLVFPVPDNVELVAAAALPEVVCTAWFNMVRLGRLAAQETVLIHGGGSGVGTMAVQLAVALGARVAVTAGSQRKLEGCLDLGASVAINYRTEDFVDVMTRDGGADVVLDHRNGPQLARDLSVLRRNGRLIALGMEEGDLAEFSLRPVLMNRLTITGSSLRASTPEEKAAIVEDVRTHVWPMFADGRVIPVIDRVVPLADAARAHQAIEDGEHFGKVVLATR
jgi:putative PIG3 family NAD(P)H quinone oxidoreductase